MAGEDAPQGLWEVGIGWFIENKLIVFLLTVMLIIGGLSVSPFDTEVGGLPRDPVPVDAIPDIGENQQIVFTSWPGRSPRDVEDQVTYPLTTALLGIPGVRSVRSRSPCRSMWNVSRTFFAQGHIRWTATW